MTGLTHRWPVPRKRAEDWDRVANVFARQSGAERAGAGPGRGRGSQRFLMPILARRSTPQTRSGRSAMRGDHVRVVGRGQRGIGHDSMYRVHRRGAGTVRCCGQVQFYANVAGHALVGGSFTVIEGGKFGSGAVAGGFSAAVTPYIPDTIGVCAGVALSSVVGGTASVLGGGKFSNGALTRVWVPFRCRCARGRRKQRTFRGDLRSHGSIADTGALVDASAA